MKTINFLNCPLHTATMDETTNFIHQRIKAKNFLQHSVVNVAKLVNMQTDDALKQSVTACDLINIDGMGVVWGARFLGHNVPQRVAGIDLFNNLLQLSQQQNYPIFLLGATQQVVTKAAANIQQNQPNLTIAGTHHGYFHQDEQSVVAQIAKSGARLLFVAMPSPQKEIFIHKYQQQFNVDFVMGVGGTFDIIAGKTTRAPIWMQNSGLEWLYRTIQEPRRMFKRYLVTNSKFAYLLLKAKLTNKKA